MATQSQEFRTVTVLSLLTGRLLDDDGFGAVHELAEFISGHPIWTHEFAMPEVWTRLKVAVIGQVPGIADVDIAALTPENFREWTAAATKRLGVSLVITGGVGERTASPLETLQQVAPHAQVIEAVGSTPEAN